MPPEEVYSHKYKSSSWIMNGKIEKLKIITKRMSIFKYK